MLFFRILFTICNNLPLIMLLTIVQLLYSRLQIQLLKLFVILLEVCNLQSFFIFCNIVSFLFLCQFLTPNFYTTILANMNPYVAVFHCSLLDFSLHFIFTTFSPFLICPDTHLCQVYFPSVISNKERDQYKINIIRNNALVYIKSLKDMFNYLHRHLPCLYVFCSLCLQNM